MGSAVVKPEELQSSGQAKWLRWQPRMRLIRAAIPAPHALMPVDRSLMLSILAH